MRFHATWRASVCDFVLIVGFSCSSLGMMCQSAPVSPLDASGMDEPATIDDVLPGGVDGGGGPPANAITATFKQGAGGYSGAKSVNISTLSAASYNGYNGTTFTDTVDWCIGDLPAQSYDISPLMRFTDLNLPPGAKVVAASLTCVFDAQVTGQRVVGHYLRVPWADSAGYNGSGVGWLRRDTALDWGAPGARGDGSDIHSGKAFSFTAFNSTGWQSKTTALDPSMVQGWVDDPAANHGVVLSVDLPDHHVGFRQPQNDRAEDRPVLSVTYTLP